MPGPQIRGALFLAAAVLSFSTMSALVKVGGAGIPTVEIVLFRGAFGLPLLLLAAWRQGVDLRGVNRRLLLLRGGTGTLAMVLLFFAVARIPVGEAMLLNQCTPIFALPLAAIVLGERITRRHAALAAVALLGVVIVIRPGVGFVNVPGLAALASALFSAASYVCVRRLTKTDATTTIVVWFTALSALSTAPFAVATWVTPSPRQLAALAGIGVTAAVGQLLLTMAYRRGEVGRLTVIGGLGAVFGTGFDLVLWGHSPDLVTALGGIVVIAACAAMQVMRARPDDRVAEH
ncbi:MAG: DMT family transporter [Proteobacteria bacterium]|jgi:drug/metabolite transporter (DMT)-like permease|nr:DMT family transporter [Pseudomonadota bacterium]